MGTRSQRGFFPDCQRTNRNLLIIADILIVNKPFAHGLLYGNGLVSPLRSGSGTAVEDNPLLSKDIRFFLEPNSGVLDMNQPTNLERRASIDTAAGLARFDGVAARPRG